ncbi:MAG TPA: LptE family protein, partial [Elusimicrobiota bacterium]|nr:LptE family protein [Elusimicrobiota bacterium]
MKRMERAGLLLAFAGLSLLIGCGEAGMYTPAPMLLPPHIRKIAVRPVANKTQFFGLEEKLRLRLEEEFIRDGRLPYVNNETEADGVVVGEIVRYIKEPISYDANHVVEEYKLWVIMNLQFIDRVNNVILWQEPRMDQEYRYFVETKPGGVTEDEARELLWELFSRDIVKRTIEGFGSVSGASQRKVS